MRLQAEVLGGARNRLWLFSSIPVSDSSYSLNTWPATLLLNLFRTCLSDNSAVTLTALGSNYAICLTVHYWRRWQDEWLYSIWIQAYPQAVVISFFFYYMPVCVLLLLPHVSIYKAWKLLQKYTSLSHLSMQKHYGYHYEPQATTFEIPTVLRTRPPTGSLQETRSEE